MDEFTIAVAAFLLSPDFAFHVRTPQRFDDLLREIRKAHPDIPDGPGRVGRFDMVKIARFIKSVKGNVDFMSGSGIKTSFLEKLLLFQPVDRFINRIEYGELRV